MGNSILEEQLRAKGIRDPRVLQAMAEVPRERFIPTAYRGETYKDGPLPIGSGQTISQPYIVALMTELLELRGNEKVLEIGTGSGYQAAILSLLAGEVYSVEVVEELALTADHALKELGYDVNVKVGDGYEGWPEHAPYDRIILTAAPERIPPALVEQLAPGGLMVLPVGRDMQRLQVVLKEADGTVEHRTITGVRFVPMVHGNQESR